MLDTYLDLGPTPPPPLRNQVQKYQQGEAIDGGMGGMVLGIDNGSTPNYFVEKLGGTYPLIFGD